MRQTESVEVETFDPNKKKYQFVLRAENRRHLLQWGQPNCVVRGKICLETTDWVPGDP